MPNQYNPLYSHELVDKICNVIATSTKSLAQACELNGITNKTFANWLNDPAKEYALQSYTRAKDEQKQFMADEIMTLTYRMAQILEDGSLSPQIANAAVSALRVQVDALKWLLSKLDPKKYGDKLDMTSGDQPLQPISIVMPK